MTQDDLNHDDRPEPGTEAVMTRLHAERPIPHPGFRGDLRGILTSNRAGPLGIQRIRVAIATSSFAGLTLLGTAGIGLTGVGPFGA